MVRFRYNKKMLLFLRLEYKKKRIADLTVAFNSKFDLDKTRTAIKTVLGVNGFTAGRAVGFGKGEKITLLNQKQIDFVKAEYVRMSTRDLLDALNEQFNLSIKLSQLRSFLKNHKILSGRTGRFEKDNVPWTAGKAGTGACKPNSGSFKKGSRPGNYKPIGSERVCKRDGYVLVKVAERNPWKTSTSGWWRHKHVVEWEKEHGPVPDGFCVRFLGSDKTNFNPENFALVSRGENARLTQMGYSQQPAEIKPVVMTLAKIDQAVYENRPGKNKNGTK